MPSKSTLPTNPTAQHVRVALGLPTDQKGNLSAAQVAEYNKGKRANKRYVPGVGRRNAAENKAQRAALVEAGFGKRGPLSAAAKEFLATHKG